MSTATTFCRYAVVALAVFGSAVAVPFAAVDGQPPARNDDGPLKVESTSPEPFAAFDPTDGTAKPPPRQQQPETASAGSDVLPVASETGLTLSTVADEEKTVAADEEKTVAADEEKTVAADAVAVQQFENAPTVAAGPDSSSFFSSVGPGPGPSSKPPYYTVRFGAPPPAMPFIMEFLQPFHPFAAFPPFPPFAAADDRRHPSKQHYQQPFPFGAPADPFASAVPSFDRLVNAYANEFRNMLASLDKDVSQMGTTDITEDVPDKPMNKTTSKTEIIDGHVVQTNETVYSNGDANHKSFFHIKEIKVLPESVHNKMTGGEAVTPVIPTVDSGKKKEDTNEIGPDSSVETFAVDDDDKQNSIKKRRGPVPLDDHYQMAASSRYAPYAPWYPSWSPAVVVHYNGPPPPPPPPVNYNGPPPPPPVSLHGDTYVNELMAAQQQANGVNAVLPPDVEFVDLNGKPQQTQGGRFYYNDHHNGPKKFPGRKY